MRSTIANFEEMSAKCIEYITKNHLIWAELLSNFTDIKKICWTAPPSDKELPAPAS